MSTVAYRVLVRCQLGATPETVAIQEEGKVLELPEAVGDACPYVERVEPLPKKSPKITTG